MGEDDVQVLIGDQEGDRTQQAARTLQFSADPLLGLTHFAVLENRTELDLSASQETIVGCSIQMDYEMKIWKPNAKKVEEMK
ncbi:hypothetical protein J6590_040496 [Homalodisca vitripennis]|nr:hypothetical protein J6590_040496 [Homalodisca vitripennis]